MTWEEEMTRKEEKGTKCKHDSAKAGCVYHLLRLLSFCLLEKGRANIFHCWRRLWRWDVKWSRLAVTHVATRHIRRNDLAVNVQR